MKKQVKLTPKQERLKRAIKPLVETILREEGETETKVSNSEIEFAELEQILSKMFKNIKFEIKYDDSDRKPKIVHSPITNQIGIFKYAISQINVGFFSWWHNSQHVAGTIDLFYQSFNGGTNGMEIMRVDYDPTNKKWKVKLSSKSV